MNKVVSHILVGLVTAGAGFGVAWTLQKRKYERLIDEEVQSVKDAYAPFRKEGAFATPESALDAFESGDFDPEADREAADALLASQGYIPVREGDTVSVSIVDGFEAEATAVAGPEGGLRLTAVDEAAPEATSLGGVPPTPTSQNLWDSRVQKEIPGEDGTVLVAVSDLEQAAEQDESEPENVNDWTAGLPARVVGKPYVISYEMFMNDDVHQDDKMSLLYFEGDETLCDEQENVLRAVEELVGEANLHFFGTGTTDKNALYIRNEKIGADYEIIRSDDTYVHAVLGQKPERTDRPLRMRDDDH